MIRVRLTQKLAAKMDGVDVSRLKVGDTIDLPDRQATLLIKEGWAKPVKNVPKQPKRGS